MADVKRQSNVSSSASRRPLFERLLKRVGFQYLVKRGPGEWSPIVWFAGLVIFFEVIVLQGYYLGTGRTAGLIGNPLQIIELVIILGAAIAVQELHVRYDKAIQRSHLRERAEEPSNFEYLVPDWLSIGIFLLGVIFTLLNAFVVLTVPQLYAIGGPATVVRFVILIPFGYVPVVATGLGTYLAAEVLIPRRLEQSEVSLDYLDPENLGGIRPLGELVKSAYYVIMLGLIGYAVATYGPHIIDGALGYERIEPPGQLTNLTFTAVWIATLLAMVYGIYVLHRFMANEKKEDILELEKEARDEFGRPWNIKEFDVADPPEGYEQYRKQIELIASTREFPAKFTMWSQLLAGALLPKVVQLLLSAA